MTYHRPHLAPLSSPLNQPVVFQRPLSLRERVEKLAQELKLLAAEVQLVEREIEEFNRYYYGEVGALYEEFKRLNAKPDMEEEGGLLLPEPEEKSHRNSGEAASLGKKIYRRLVKISHPDSGESTLRPEFFVKLTEAYKTSDLGALVLLEQQARQQVGGVATERTLEEQLHGLRQAFHSLEHRKNALLSSPSYKLRQKIFWAKMGGQDLMGQIKRHLERQIAAAK